MKKSSKYNPIANALKANSVNGTSYIFKGQGLAKTVDPFTGNGFLVLDAIEKNPNVSINSKLKANSWAPVSLSVSVKGKLPPCQVPFKY